MLWGTGHCVVYRRQGCSKAAHDAVHYHCEGEGEQFLAPGEVVPDGTDSQPGLIGHFPQRGPLQPVTCDDPENGFDHVLAPGFGIYDFGHYFYLARMCSSAGRGMPCGRTSGTVLLARHPGRSGGGTCCWDSVEA